MINVYCICVLIFNGIYVSSPLFFVVLCNNRITRTVIREQMILQMFLVNKAVRCLGVLMGIFLIYVLNNFILISYYYLEVLNVRIMFLPIWC